MAPKVIKLFKKVNFLSIAFILLVIGITLHAYKNSISNENQIVTDTYQAKLNYYNENNLYYDPKATIRWLAARQHPDGYFVENPDSMDEPSQLNSNTLQATRHALLTLYRLDGIWDINKANTVNYIYSNYQSKNINGQEVAGFSNIKDEALGLRPTMDALLSLWRLNAIDSSRVDLNKIKQFILLHQNPDGGFWDPYYSEVDKSSCLRCTSFALSALSIINSRLHSEESTEFKKKVIKYINSTWQEDQQVYSDSKNNQPHSSFDIFRAYLSLSTLEPGAVSQRIAFAKAHFKADEQIATIKKHFMDQHGIFTAQYDSNIPSMKATHLLIWLYTDLEIMDQLDQTAIVRFVLDNQNQPGEYGGDIYNTYSATSILKRLGVSTKALEKPIEPEKKDDPTPEFAPYILYLMSLGAIAFYFLQNARHLESKAEILETQIQFDSLTGLYNRHYVENYFNVHQHEFESLFMILIDVDHFKLINDNYGHLIGDEALKQISKYISQHLQGNDILARWGGEEFIILSSNKQQDEAIALAETIRHFIQDQVTETIGKITCSCGVSQYIKDESFQSFFERTDKAMYTSKNQGRNKVTYI